LRLLDKWVDEIHSGVGLELPMEPEQICAYLAVEYRRRVMHPCIDGLYYRTTTGVPFVYVNSRFRLMGRQRFTAAHEIGHHLIATACREKGCRFVDSAETAFSPVEAAANRLAANLLMPEKLVREFWEDLSSNRRYRIQIMADRFEVTKSAMRIRAEELRLLRTDSVKRSSDEIPCWHTF
jgi:Zn-dependent peptidase ImmA (M78 family)